MSNLKVEGEVADFCPKCKNCKSTTRGYDGTKDWLTEVECEDPYDGMVKTLSADSDICCSMFEPKPDRRCEKCERFDGTYCHGPNGTITISYKALFGEPVNCPSYSEKKEPCESEESRIEELIKASKRKDDLIQDYREKLKKANDEINLLNSKVDKLGEYYRTDEKLIDNIQKVIFPQEEDSDYTYSYDEILNKVKDLKDKYEKLYTHYRYDEDIIKDIQDAISPEDNSIWSYSEIVNEIKNLKKRSADSDYYKEKSELLDKRNTNQFVIIGEKDKKIESLNTINKGLADDLRVAKDKLNYLYFKAKEFADKED